MQKTLIITPGRCIGCRTCELACSFKHAPEKGGLGKSRIGIRSIGQESYMPLTCMQCANPACMTVCPVHALWRNEETGAIEVKRDRCIGCALCTIVCPFGHIVMGGINEELNKSVKCDLCGGEPACAAFCPSRALEYA